MFQPPGSSEMMRVVHEVEIAEDRRRARLNREAGGRLGLRRSIGRALIAIGLFVSGERPRIAVNRDEAIPTLSAPSAPRSATADRGC